jgi:hypothetical protein
MEGLAMSTLIPFPGKIGETICLPAMKAVPDTPSTDPLFAVGDICSFPPFTYTFQVQRIDGDDVYFERMT